MLEKPRIGISLETSVGNPDPQNAKILMFLGLPAPDPDPLLRGTEPDPAPDLDPSVFS